LASLRSDRYEISEFAVLLEEIVGPQHHRSFSVDWPFEELTRCSLLNRVAQPQKLICSLICLHLMLAFKVVHRRGADRTPHCLAQVKYREINDHPIEVVAQYFASLQRHCKSSVLNGLIMASRPALRDVRAGIAWRTLSAASRSLRPMRTLGREDARLGQEKHPQVALIPQVDASPVEIGAGGNRAERRAQAELLFGQSLPNARN
jgi:hypothetical protein